MFRIKKIVRNVRKWPNLCCIGLGMFGKLIVKLKLAWKLVGKFRPIDQFLKHSQVKGYPNIQQES